jgi:hypothetical protein
MVKTNCPGVLFMSALDVCVHMQVLINPVFLKLGKDLG